LSVPPSSTLADLHGSDDQTERDALIAAAGSRLSAAGMHKVDEQLYVLDLGISTRTFRVASESPTVEVKPETLEGGALWLHHARAYRAMLAAKTFRTQADIAKDQGFSVARMTQIMALLRLDDALQNEVIAGHYGSVSEIVLRRFAGLRTKTMQRGLIEHAKQMGASELGQSAQRLQEHTTVDATVRLVLYFNPHMFAEMRATAERHRREIETYLRDLNARLRCKNSRTTRESVFSDITAKLAAQSMLSIYSVHVDTSFEDGHEHLTVALEFDENEWGERRKDDGFVLLVAHAELPHSAQELVAVYRAKDAVEKDFQTIKTDIKLRPVFHHTDPKVRAHVSLCMLALLLERTIERRLREAGAAMTARQSSKTSRVCT